MDKLIVTRKNWRGKTETRQFNYTLDIRDYLGAPGWALLAIAANTHLSVSDLLRFLADEGVERSRSWLSRRRWLFQKPGTVNTRNKPNGDGLDAQAREIMWANPTLSVRQLARLLLNSGIDRNREWVRRHRVH